MAISMSWDIIDGWITDKDLMDDYLNWMLMKWCWCDNSTCIKKMGQKIYVIVGFMKTYAKGYCKRHGILSHILMMIRNDATLWWYDWLSHMLIIPLMNMDWGSSY